MDDHRASTIRAALIAMFACGVTGCVAEPPTLETYLGRHLVVAVAPALNHSASIDFDPVRMADLMVSEMTHFGGVRTLPVNRVLAQLKTMDQERVDSPEQAVQLGRRLGADRVLIFTVNEYDPYWPPILSITAQLYGRGSQEQVLDPVALSRQMSGQDVEFDPLWPSAETQRVFNGSDERLLRDMRIFASWRDADDSPFGWRKFLGTQENFTRFCCHLVLRELFEQEVAHVAQ